MLKRPINNIQQKRSSLLFLVIFVFATLLVSILVSGLIWQIFTEIGILPSISERGHTHAFLFLLLVSLLVGTILATIGGDYLLRPLRRLTIATKEIAAGNFNVQVNVSGSKELERLAESFNEMARELGKIETLRADFVSNISHEYKTPVASIKGFAKRLMKNNLSDEQRIEYLKIIIFESERLARLSGNVLLLSNLETGERDTAQTTFFLDEQLRKLVLLLEPQLQKKQLTIELDLDPIQIMANEEMLQHVWLNILGNAIKFSHEKGIVEVILKSEEKNAVVSVIDHGIGMDEGVKKQMFEKFYQGDRSRATAGNGLGMSLVKRILDIETGRITVDSSPNEGTRFTVSLPHNTNPHLKRV